MPHQTSSPQNDVIIEAFQPIDKVSKREKLSSFADKTKTKAREILGTEHVETHEDTRTVEQKQIDELHTNAAYNPLDFVNRPRTSTVGHTDRAIGKIQSFAAGLAHPKDAIKSRATKATADHLARSRPFISRRADLDFLNAYNDREDVKESKCPHDNDEETQKKDGRIGELDDDIVNIQERTMSMRVAWETNRHVHRVKAVRREPGIFPPDEYFEKVDEDGQTEFQWGHYIAERLLYSSRPYTAQYIDEYDELPFDIQILRRHVERLVMVSAPTQQFLSKIRKIYRWDDPQETGKLFLLYWTLWYFKHIPTFAIGFFIYTVLRNYHDPTDLDSMKESIERALDRGQTAMKVAELMDRHGNHDWLGPLMDELGPYIQLQINDTANFLECIYNFYNWKSPEKTRAALTLISVPLLMSLFGSSAFCMTTFWFVFGVTFFICWPISSRYPKYRLMVSPFKWALWDVPTHAEWSFQYLQQRSVTVLKALEVKKEGKEFTGTEGLGHVFSKDGRLYVENQGADAPEVHDIPKPVLKSPHRYEGKRPVDILSLSCVHANTPGQLIISSVGIRFHSSTPHALNSTPTSDFFVAYPQIEEMVKRGPKSRTLEFASKFTGALDRLELKVRIVGDVLGDEEGLVDGAVVMRTILLEGMKARDKAFNAIIGFSGTKWQNLQGGGDD